MYSSDIRLLAFSKIQNGQGIRWTARILEVSPSTVHRWVHSSWWAESNTRRYSKRLKRRRRSRSKRTDQVLSAATSFFLDEKNSVASNDALRRRLQDVAGESLSLTTTRRIIRDIRFSRKRLSNKVLGIVSDDQVAEYKKRHDASVMGDTLVVSLDECNSSEKAQPLYGYSHIGSPCKLRHRKGSWVTRSLVLGIATDGTSHHMLVEGSVTRELFGEFLLDMPYPPGTVVLMDNCSIHYKLEEVFDAKGYIPLFLSPYSPDFQPVELAFSKIKGMFRRLWPWEHGVEQSVETCTSSLTETDIYGFFKHANSLLNSSQIYSIGSR